MREVSYMLEPIALNMNPFDAYRSVVRFASETTAAVAGTEPKTSLLSPDQFAGYTVVAIITIINLLIAYFILKHFLFKPIMKVLNDRRTYIANELDNAENRSKEAQKLFDEASLKIEASKSEASTIVTEARVQADKQARTVINAAQTEANVIVDRASEDAKRMHNAMLDQMRDEVADLAVSIASKVVGSIIDDTHQKDLNERIMDETLKAEVKKID